MAGTERHRMPIAQAELAVCMSMIKWFRHKE
jgi:hypothetical protein